MRAKLFPILWCIVVSSTPMSVRAAGAIIVSGQQVVLETPDISFTLDTADGLRAVSWENRLTRRKLNLGNGPEIGIDLGLPSQTTNSPQLRVTKVPGPSRGKSLEATFELAADNPPASVLVTYRWDDKQPVLRKFVTITNRGATEWNRLLNVHLGNYKMDVRAEKRDPDYPVQVLESHLGGETDEVNDPAGRKRGYPAYIEWQFFASLAHPAGFASRQNGALSLRQLPGIKLAPGATFNCMEAVYGVSREGEARKAFRDYVHGRMRRVLRGHDKPLAILESFGGKPDGEFWVTEDYILGHLAKVAEGQRNSDLHWDYYSIEFWHDSKGDLKSPDRGRFPHGFTNVVADLKKLDTRLGLWLDSGQLAGWTVGDNPAVAPARIPPHGSLCRATAPLNQFYIEGYAHQLRNNCVRLVKFDNAQFTCDNPAHDHLPGDYSTEPIQNAIIEFFRSLDRECPDVFIMLYWNYQSPWWLLHADTLYDIGMKMEGASFTPYPTLRARESVARRLDQGRWMVKDLPALGWDTLGIWLSDWPWNSRIGKESWQDGMVMDLCRGNLLAQLWTDTAYLSPDERQQMTDFIALFKAHPDCFRNPRFILGNPWKNEPYGYCCTDGQRAFIAINNGVWQENRFTLQLNSKWGLPNGKRWKLYRHWPEPAQLGGKLGAKPSIVLRPFEITLLEAVSANEPPTLTREFEDRPLPKQPLEPAQPVSITVEQPREPEDNTRTNWTVLEPLEFRSTGGANLTNLPDHSILAEGKNPSPDTYVIKARAPLQTITAFCLEALPHHRLPHGGPGRAINGNFTVTEFKVSAAPLDNSAALQPVRISRADADFSQTSDGNWVINTAIDGNPSTGWGIHPEESAAHAAIFELEQPIAFPQGAALEFKLDHWERGHNLGRFRLLATGMKSPVSVPTPKPSTQFILRGNLPVTKSGGVFAMSIEFRQAKQPFWTRRGESAFSVAGTVSAQPVTFQPAVRRDGWYSSPWQTWRAPAQSSANSQPFEIRVNSSLPDEVEHHFSAHLIPHRTKP